MGGNSSKSYASFNQSVNNSIFHHLSQDCIADVDNNIEGVTIIIVNSKITGGIRFNQLSNAYASCTMEQTVDNTLTNAISAISSQSTDVQNSLISFSPTSTETRLEIEQRIKNQITQILSSSCRATIRKGVKNVTVYAVNTNIAGDIEFTQTGDSSAVCAMNNSSRLALFNQILAEGKMTTSITSLFSFIGLIAVAVTVFIVLGVTVYFIMKKGNSQPTESESPGGSLISGASVPGNQTSGASVPGIPGKG